MMVNWAICDGDVCIVKALRSILGWRTTTWWRRRSAWRMATDPIDITRWKHKFGFHNRRVQWDTPTSKRHEGRPAQGQKTGKRTEKGKGGPTKKPRDLLPIVIQMPAEDEIDA